jgi:hypothetical protein
MPKKKNECRESSIKRDGYNTNRKSEFRGKSQGVDNQVDSLQEESKKKD